MMRNSIFALIGLTVAVAAGPIATPAQADLIDRKGMTIVEARNAMRAAVDEATKNGWKLVIAIVDDGARLI